MLRFVRAEHQDVGALGRIQFHLVLSVKQNDALEFICTVLSYGTRNRKVFVAPGLSHVTCPSVFEALHCLPDVDLPINLVPNGVDKHVVPQYKILPHKPY